MGMIDKLKKQYENEPWLECNSCGVVFKGNHECDYEKLKQQNAIYRQALEFYAIESKYEFEIELSTSDMDVKSEIFKDYGETARKALNQ